MNGWPSSLIPTHRRFDPSYPLEWDKNLHFVTTLNSRRNPGFPMAEIRGCCFRGLTFGFAFIYFGAAKFAPVAGAQPKVLYCLIGNPVGIRNGPAAVFGDDRRTTKSLPKRGREDAVIRKIRKSEDLPWGSGYYCLGWIVPQGQWIKIGIPC